MHAFKKSCLVCDTEMHGRKDKLFCSDYCRAVHHNNLYADKIAMIRKTNNILLRNRKILFNLNPHGTTTIHKLQLIESGFAFQYHTNTQATPDGNTIVYCYDQGYISLTGEKYLLLRNDHEHPHDHLHAFKTSLVKKHQPVSPGR